MSYSAYHKKSLLERELHPETQMMSYGYDPFLSEGSVKPPVFLTSTFAFRSAEDGAEFFDVVAGRKTQPQDAGAGLVYSRFNHPNLEIVEDRQQVLCDKGFGPFRGGLLLTDGPLAVVVVLSLDPLQRRLELCGLVHGVTGGRGLLALPLISDGP